MELYVGSPVAAVRSTFSHAAMFTATGSCATVEIINYRPFAAAIVIFVRSAAS
jgi:hypothetical protein